MKYSCILVFALMLSACQSSEEKKAEWIKFCTDGEFTSKQCNVLYSIKESSDEANDSAATAVGLSAVGIGMSGMRR